MDTIIKCENVSFKYDESSSNKSAIYNLNLEIERGSFVVILGKNGSGKSTLGKLMNGILVPTEGKITVDGMDTSDDSKLIDIRKKVGMVFQNPDNQLVSNIVEEDIAFGPENLGLPSEEIRERVDNALKTVGMTEYKRHAPHKLSGGQKQRVAIAGILAMNPECIIFDESTSMLDPQGRKEIIETIKRLNSQEKITTVLVTHYMNEAIEGNRVIVMNDGRIAVDGTPREIFSQVELLNKIGLDVPQPTELLYMLSENPELSKKFEFKRGILSEDEASEYIIKLFGEKNKCQN